ncbi:hypothetical protein ACRCPS_31120 [Pseudomonas aeruginosa]
MSDQPGYFTYYCTQCQQEHMQPCFGAPPAEKDRPTSCGNDYPEYPSAVATVEAERYGEAVEALKGKRKVFFDGETILVPESAKDVLALLRDSFGATFVYGYGAEYEYATKASQAGIGGRLLKLGQFVHTRIGQTPDEMVKDALERPGPTLLAWESLARSARTLH